MEPASQESDDDESITITITESGDEATEPVLSEDEAETPPEEELTMDWLVYENSRLRAAIPRLKQAIKTRDGTIKAMRRDAKKAAALAKKYKGIILDINQELAEVHKQMLILKSEKEAAGVAAEVRQSGV
eukprot:TRINITY_DN20046_c0_g1_i1.p1 TRINITY_DN20046_c0_g1~~TRINITY_DN20046_c0_g1_i1.p1  ORF type:complete len:130 (+),score=58.31 TRINITY_DN20046_c0_g1_i1:229-618(+)